MSDSEIGWCFTKDVDFLIEQNKLGELGEKFSLKP
jgi:hypothetical protein